MKILISGAGIAGTCLAYWLERHGFTPTLVERAPQLRSGGYIIDFWGAGFDVADRMGLMPAILEQGYKVRALRQVDREGKRVSGFALAAFDRITHGRYTSLSRGALAACLFGALNDRVETIFGDSISAIEDAGNEVRVRFVRSPRRAFDLVIGADGLHSNVRQLVFGAESRFERFLGLKVAAFEAEGYPIRDPQMYVVHREVGQQVGRFSLRDDRAMFLFVFADRDHGVPDDLQQQKALLRERFANSGWECPEILHALGSARELYMDRVSQIQVPRWTQGRTALVGDAAFCISLLGGQGSALAMVAAYVLAGELKRAGGDHAAAFPRYQARLGAFIAAKQDAARKFSSFFAPHSRFGIFVGNQAMKLMSIPFMAELAAGRELRDTLELPEY